MLEDDLLGVLLLMLDELFRLTVLPFLLMELLFLLGELTRVPMLLELRLGLTVEFLLLEFERLLRLYLELVEVPFLLDMEYPFLLDKLEPL